MKKILIVIGLLTAQACSNDYPGTELPEDDRPCAFCGIDDLPETWLLDFYYPGVLDNIEIIQRNKILLENENLSIQEVIDISNELTEEMNSCIINSNNYNAVSVLYSEAQLDIWELPYKLNIEDCY